MIRIHNDEGIQVDTLYILRFQPDFFWFRVEYRPGQPLSLQEWQELGGALVVVNGAFFDPEFVATALVILEGNRIGRSYQGFGGMLAIGDEGLEILDLAYEPYDPVVAWQYAMQSFPILIHPGGAESYEGGDADVARRTVVAKDRSGRVLFMVTAWGSFTLGDLSQYLLSSDLDIDVALNLDGGASTGILLAKPAEGIPSFSALPLVLTVHPRK